MKYSLILCGPERILLTVSNRQGTAGVRYEHLSNGNATLLGFACAPQNKQNSRDFEQMRRQES